MRGAVASAPRSSAPASTTTGSVSWRMARNASVSPGARTITSSPHLPGVIAFDAAGALRARLGRSVAVTNDATAAALAEWRLGAGRGVEDVVMITMGTGIGGGVVAGGRLLPGPFSELNMAAGLTPLAFRDFAVGTLLGCLPKAIAWSGVGAALS